MFQNFFPSNPREVLALDGNDKMSRKIMLSEMLRTDTCMFTFKREVLLNYVTAKCFFGKCNPRIFTGSAIVIYQQIYTCSTNMVRVRVIWCFCFFTLLIFILLFWGHIYLLGYLSSHKPSNMRDWS